MRIAFVIPQYLPSVSGDVKQTHQMAKYLVEKGDNVTIFTTDAGSDDALTSNKGVILKQRREIIDGVEVLRFPIQSRFLSKFRFLVENERQLKNTREIDKYIENMTSSSRSAGNLTDYVRRVVMAVRPPIAIGLYKSLLGAENFDIYHIVGISLSNALYAYQASLKNKIPLVIKPSFHTADKLYYNPTNFNILKHANAILANTDAETEIFSKFGVDTSKITVVGSGLDLEMYSNVNTVEVEKIRSAYEFQNYEMTVLFISRLQMEKGLLDVMDAVIDLNSRGRRVQAIIAGADFAATSLFVKKMSIKYPFIKYAGRVTEDTKISLLHACDVLVVPSIVDSFGIVYIEAWACKKPVIGADIPSTRALMSYGDDGFYVEFGDKKGLADKIEYLTDNYDKRLSMGHSGFNKVRNRYTNHIVFDSSYAVYTRLIGRSD